MQTIRYGSLEYATFAGTHVARYSPSGPAHISSYYSAFTCVI